MFAEPVSTETHEQERSDFDARIGAAWTKDALLEHASIASFARFTLELLAVGAPPKLVVASQSAGRDEVQHAQKCFLIASRFSGKKLGPGPLDLTGVEAARDLRSVAIATVHEGCVNETVSAALAEERAEGAEDDAVRAALHKIATDEARHAKLAWDFVAWAIDKGGAPIREAVTRAFASAQEHHGITFDSNLRGIPSERLRRCGLLDEVTARSVVERSHVELIAPRAARLLAV
jgi:hypothetical protein